MTGLAGDFEACRLIQSSLPVAITMFGLSLGVQRMDTILPSAVYALLSGLNASTVGIVALAAVQVRISVGLMLRINANLPLARRKGNQGQTI